MLKQENVECLKQANRVVKKKKKKKKKKKNSIWVEECTKSYTGIVRFAEDFDVITIVFQLQYLE